MDLDTLLMEWDLAGLIPSFKSHEITLDNITLLSEDSIKELIPIIGQRIVFLKNLEQFKRDTLVVPILVNDSTSEVHSSDTSSVVTTEELYIVPFKEINETALSVIYPSNIDFPAFDLKTLLTVSPYGDLILNYYKSKNSLNDYLRNKLVDIIVKHIYSYIMQRRLTHSEYNILCAKIIQVFPSECASKYYQPGRRVNNIATQPKGKLVDKMRNLLYKSPDKVYVRKKRRLTADSGQSSSSEIENHTEDHRNAITWLRFNREPWDDVLRLWKVTHTLRQANQAKSAAEFIESWPSIEDPRANSLIETDFQLLHPGNEVSLLNKWDTFFEIVRNIKCEDITNKDPILEDLLSHLQDNAENLTESAKHAIQLMALARLIPPKGRLVEGKSQWKFSTIEAVEAIIVHCQSPGHIEETIAKVQEKAFKRKVNCNIQPYLVVVGETIANINCAYLIIDKIQFHFKSVLKAFDVLFKTFFSLNIKYPPQAEHVYNLIQKGIFKINLDTDKDFPYIANILIALDKQI